MSIKVNPHHPVAEEIARILSGIGGCPSLQQMKMVNEAAKRAAARVDEANARAEKAEAELAEFKEQMEKLKITDAQIDAIFSDIQPKEESK